MEWNEQSLRVLTKLFLDKYVAIHDERMTDRLNRSLIWAKYLSSYGAVVIRDEPGPKKPQRRPNVSAGNTLQNLVDLVNFSNESVAGALLIRNPDRAGQYILVPRDMAERIMVLGML